MEAEGIFSDKHNASLDKSLNATLQQTLTIETVNLVNRLPTLLVEIALLGFAVWLVLKPGGNARPGDVVAVLLLAPMLMSPIQALSAYLVMATKAWPDIEKVFDILESRGQTEGQPGAVDTQLVAPTIEARNVRFSYQLGSRQIFTSLSFTIPPEKTTGLVAKMGQGKTTFFKLALRFYDPHQGQILVGGRPTTDYAPDTLRQRIAMMSQFPAFFFDTVRENLRMAKPAASDQELQGICERTGVWKILSQKLPPRRRARFWTRTWRQVKHYQAVSENYWRSRAVCCGTLVCSFSTNQPSAWITRRNSRFAKCSARAHAVRLSWSSITMLTGCSNFAITSSF